jgi:transcriptional regulator with XRE-family HTH domain
MTISELARRAGVSRDTISKVERGDHEPNATTVSKIARALGTTPSKLYATEERLQGGLADFPIDQIRTWLADEEAENERLRDAQAELTPNDIRQLKLAYPALRKLAEIYGRRDQPDPERRSQPEAS